MNVQKDFGMYSGYNVEGSANIEITPKAEENYSQAQGMYASCQPQPIYECPCENVVHRQICHNVEHVVPIRTKICNHHIYKHNYVPCYSCCEENDVCHIDEGYQCNRFR